MEVSIKVTVRNDDISYTPNQGLITKEITFCTDLASLNRIFWGGVLRGLIKNAVREHEISMDEIFLAGPTKEEE